MMNSVSARSFPINIAQPQPKISWNDYALDSALTAASYLYDPLLKVHQWKWQICVLDKIYPTASKVELFARKILYTLGIIGAALLAIPCTIIGFIIRSVALTLTSKKFLHSTSNALEVNMDQSLTIYSANLCGAPGGHSISDGGVLPWQFRIDDLISAINSQDKQVVCLFEIFDVQMAHSLIAGLGRKYRHFYYGMGSNHLGPTSGLFVASKIKISEPCFEFFSKANLDGRSKHSNKGFFHFAIAYRDAQVRIYSTHMGHSEEPSQPTKNEIDARVRQRQQIVSKMADFQQQSQILTGDLNLDSDEFDSQGWGRFFDKGTVPNENTWGGDPYMAKVVGKKASPPSTLDYTMAFRGSSSKVEIQTQYLQTGYDGTQFKATALSDHSALLSTVTVA